METTHFEARRIVEDFLRTLDTLKLDDILAYFAPEATLVIPLSIDGTPAPWFTFEGIDQIRDYWSNATSSLDRLAFSRTDITVSTDATTVFCEAEGDMRRGDQEYRNVYVFRFDLVDGKIVRLLEYGNPVTAARFGGGNAIDGLDAISAR